MNEEEVLAEEFDPTWCVDGQQLVCPKCEEGGLYPYHDPGLPFIEGDTIADVLNKGGLVSCDMCGWMMRLKFDIVLLTEDSHPIYCTTIDTAVWCKVPDHTCSECGKRHSHMSWDEVKKRAEEANFLKGQVKPRD